jgi:hypothetical protein
MLNLSVFASPPVSEGRCFAPVDADLEDIHSLLDHAQALAHDGRYREAGVLLKNAHATVISLLGSTSLMYDFKLHSAAKEFDYQMAHYHSYEDLVPSLIAS